LLAHDRDIGTIYVINAIRTAGGTPPITLIASSASSLASAWPGRTWRRESNFNGSRVGTKFFRRYRA
jgi:hypothetical protein